VKKIYLETSFRRIVWGADAGRRFRGEEYFEGLALKDQAKFEPVFRNVATEPRTHNTTRFRKESDGIWCFKCHKRRLACFFDGRDVVVIYGFDKKADGGRRETRELATAVRLRQQYLEGKG
jgi:hypothetical protein